MSDDEVEISASPKPQPNGAPNPVCVASVNVLLLVLPDGRVQTKVEHWKADDTALELMVKTMPGIAKYLDGLRKPLIHKPVLVGLPRPFGN